MGSNASTRARVSTFLDPLDIFGMRKGAAAQQYSQQSANIAQQQQNTVNQMIAERQAYQARAEQAMSQSPQYNIPTQVGQYADLMRTTGQDIYSNLYKIASELGATDYTKAGQEALTSGYGNALNLANTGAQSLRDIYNKGVSESEGYAKQGMQQGLSDINGFTNYYRQLAGRTEMPGQTATENKINRNFAEAYKALGQQAGGSASGLGAMIDAYTQKANTLSDIGIQAAQYKSGQEQALAAAQERAMAARQGIYNQMEQGTLSRAAALGGAEQAATGMQTAAQTAQADALSNYALYQQQSANQSAQTRAALMSQGAESYANMAGQGLLTQAGYQDTAYQYNQLMPYQTQMNYYNNLISSLNPYAAQFASYGQQQENVNNLYQLFGKQAVWANM